jgi:hypothetical protein
VKTKILLLQFVLTLVVLALVPENFHKVLLLLPLWWFSFRGFTAKEVIAFFIINGVFVVSDIGAVQNGFFEFKHPDFFGLPVWEFFMWGYYLLHTHRMFPSKLPKHLDLRLLVLAVAFAAMFALILDRSLLLAATSGTLLMTLYFYHEKDDLLYCGYLMLLGFATEFVGIRFNLWSYPERDFNSAFAQFLVMWGATGIYFRRIMARWLYQPTPMPTSYEIAHEKFPERLRPDFEKACVFCAQREFEAADKIFEFIEIKARKESLKLNYDFYSRYSHLCITEGNLRKAAELSREGFSTCTSPLEKAYLHLQLCRIYRMMILMKNAQFELQKAFAEMKMEYPRDSALQALKTLISFLFQQWMPMKTVSDEASRKRLQMQVALYEEAGLSGYYFLEYPMMLQCTLKSKAPAFKLGDSIQLVNWLGGSGCVWAVLGWKGQASKLIEESLTIGKKISMPYGISKALLWRALFLNYQGFSKESAIAFGDLLKNHATELSPYDLRLVATTLSCNYLIRGHMKGSEECIRDLAAFDVPRSRYFSCAKAFVDWYRLPALGFLGEDSEAASTLKNSQVVFHRVDEEKWQITQFLGGLLTYYYTLKSRNISDIRECLSRFSALKLSSRRTYLEASQIWVAKAHLFIDLAREGSVPLEEAKASVQELSRVQSHPDLRAHWLVAKAKLALLENKIDTGRGDSWSRQAGELAATQENIWVQYETLQYQWLKLTQHEDKTAIENKIRDFCVQHHWKGMLR